MSEVAVSEVRAPCAPDPVVSPAGAAAAAPESPAVRETPPPGGASRQYVRGSSLMLAGRVIAIFLNLAVQVLAIRALAKSDYGAFAYALGVVAMASNVIQVGLGKAIPRLVPIYLEQKNFGRAFGAIALTTGTVLGLGLSTVLLLHGFASVLAGRVFTDPLSLSVLLILIALAPLTAFDNILEVLAAVFVGPRAVFFRRHVLGPGLKLAAVVMVILAAGDVYLLAYGYLAGGLIGVSLYMAILLREWRSQGLLQHARPGRLELPTRELFGFGIPMFSSGLLVVLPGFLAVVMLEHFHAPTAVAEYRAVLPVAGLNMLVYDAFALLFVPVASRMFARAEREQISALYWQTSIWITVLAFPIFAVTCSLAQPVTTLLFGTEYAGAGTLLAVLAVGHYFCAALGFNAATLRVYGKTRFIVASDVATALLSVALNLALIRGYGALGAALGTTATLILRNVVNQVGLRICGTGIRLLEWQFMRVYLIATLMMVALLLIQRLVHPPVYVGCALVGLAALLVIRLTRRTFSPAGSFPELLRIPLLRQLLT